MFIQTVTTVTIDPVKEAEVYRQYKESHNWRCISEGTTCCVFEDIRDIIKCDTPFFIDNKDGGDDG